MKKGDRVNTEYGSGIIIYCEGNEGILKERVCVKVDCLDSESLKRIQNIFGGLYFFKSELKLIQ